MLFALHYNIITLSPCSPGWRKVAGGGSAPIVRIIRWHCCRSHSESQSSMCPVWAQLKGPTPEKNNIIRDGGGQYKKMIINLVLIKGSWLSKKVIKLKYDALLSAQMLWLVNMREWCIGRDHSLVTWDALIWYQLPQRLYTQHQSQMVISRDSIRLPCQRFTFSKVFFSPRSIVLIFNLDMWFVVSVRSKKRSFMVGSKHNKHTSCLGSGQEDI